MAGRLRALRRYAQRAKIRHRALARLARAADGRAVARSSVVVCLRLRVRAGTARARLSHGVARRRSPRPSHRTAPRPPRSSRVEGASLSRAEGGVLPPRLHSRPVGAGRSRDRSRARARRRADATRRVAVPPARQSALRRRARTARDRRRGPRRRPAAHGRAASGDPSDARCRHSSCPSTRSTPRASSRSPTSSSRREGP